MDDSVYDIITPTEEFISLQSVIYAIGRNFDSRAISNDLIMWKRAEFPTDQKWESWKRGIISKTKAADILWAQEQEEDRRIWEAWVSRNPQKVISAEDSEDFWLFWDEWQDSYCNEYLEAHEEWWSVRSASSRELSALMLCWEAWEGVDESRQHAKGSCVNYERNRRAAARLLRALQHGEATWFIAVSNKGTTNAARLADDQYATGKIVYSYLERLTEIGKPEDIDLWGESEAHAELKDRTRNIYFEINELIALLNQRSIAHPYRVTAPLIDIGNGDAESPATNLLFKKPARLCGAKDMPSLVDAWRFRQIRNREGELTKLSQYLELELWTPAMAAMLTCGLQPSIGATGIPDCAVGLWYRGNAKVNSTNCAFFEQAEELLGRWNLQRLSPSISNVTPEEWITWCGEQQIPCQWLRDIKLAADWIDYLYPDNPDEKPAKPGASNQSQPIKGISSLSPADAGYWSLVGKPAIAQHLGMSEGWVRDHLRKGLPHKKQSNKRVVANSDEVEQWFNSLKKNDPLKK